MRKQVISPEAVAARDAAPATYKNFTVEMAAAHLGVGRAFVFELIRQRKLKSVKLGRRRLIPGPVLERFVADLAKDAA